MFRVVSRPVEGIGGGIMTVNVMTFSLFLRSGDCVFSSPMAACLTCYEDA